MKKRAQCGWGILFVLTVLFSPSEGATLFVSPEGDGTDGLSWETAFPTVGDAIFSATDGDEVWVRSATYSENVSIRKSITLLGGFFGNETLDQRELRNPDQNETVLDSQRNGPPVMTIAYTTAVVQGFTLTNGLASIGSGMHITHATATVLDTTISNNGDIEGSWSSGGLIVFGSHCEIGGCVIHNNAADLAGGAAVDRSTIQIRETIFRENRAHVGGGLHIGKDSTVTIDSCVFEGNASVQEIIYPGGGGFGGGGNPYPSGGQGGAIYLQTISPYEPPTTLRVTNTVFDRNTFGGPTGSGAIFYGRGKFNAEFINCTGIMGARAGSFGLYPSGSATPPVMHNCIFVSEPGEIAYFGSGSRAIVSHSLIEGGWPGEGNIDTDPKFVDFENGDYHLLRSSPCIDSGTDTGLTSDFDGNPRPIGDYDMGAFEFPFLRSDINGDDRVDSTDLLILQQDWKKVSGP